MNPARYADLFAAEAREHIGTLNRLLLSLEATPDDAGAVDELFRAAHTLKGMSAAMGYVSAAELAHALEHMLEQLRTGALRADAETVDLLLQSADALEQAVGSAAGKGEEPPVAGDPRPVLHDQSRPANRQLASDGGQMFRVAVALFADAALPAARALLVLQRARTLGEVSEANPAEEALAAGECGGSLRFVLRTGATRDEIRSLLGAAGEVQGVELEPVGNHPAANADADADGDPEAPLDSFVRIRQSRLDSVLNQLGEMVIARDRLVRVAEPVPAPGLADAVGDLARLVGELRDEVMRLRMVPVGEAFDRFPRLVRDLARALDKRVELELRGGEHELDRSLLRETSDLLVHLLRNSVDHGVESPADRVAAGKPEAAVLRVSAQRDRDALLVRVEDDGRGISPRRVLRTAVEQGLIGAAEAASLSHSEVLSLLTRPGFSTARSVTELSGRGVGLDAVRTRVLELGGSLAIESVEGAGAAFTLRLPLTLSIVRVLLVEAGGAVYALPMSGVAEVVEVRAAEVLREAGSEWVRVRGELVPLLRLPRLLAPDAPPEPGPWLLAAVVGGGGERVCVAVDRLCGQQEAVVKPFDAPVGMVHLFSGATLLPDGRPSLILDPARLAGRVQGARPADAA